MDYEESSTASKELLFADYDQGYSSRTSSVQSVGYSSRTPSVQSVGYDPGYSSRTPSVQSVGLSSSDLPGGYSRGLLSRLYKKLQ